MRHAVAPNRDCRLGVISFQDLAWTEHSVTIVDLSVTGLGIASDHPIKPGVIWFKEHVYGQKCGFLVWCGKNGDRYRGGIQFVSLMQEEEKYLREQLDRLQPHEPFQDPEGVVTRMMISFKNQKEGSASLSGEVASR
jgi:hypothetical protein